MKRLLFALLLSLSAVMLGIAFVPRSFSTIAVSNAQDAVSAPSVRREDQGEAPSTPEDQIRSSQQSFTESDARCATEEVDEVKKEKLRKAHKRFEAKRRTTSDSQMAARAAGTVIIPVYFHVIMDDAGNGNVSDATLDEQINVLNRSYGGQTGGANTPFRFVKVETTRTTNESWFNADGRTWQEWAAVVNMKSTLRRGGQYSLNFYTKDLRGTRLGYATYPWDYASDPARDGVVCRYSSLPGGAYVRYNEGDSGTHEVGHWLGLFHTFEGECSQPNDEVSDTPAEKSEEFKPYECPILRDTCPSDPGPDPVENFMDYSEDSCMHRFTPGQSSRMDLMFAQYRGNPIDDTRFFVRQQFLDTLRREPDQAGWDGWSAHINHCAPGDTACIQHYRTSAAKGILESDEFRYYTLCQNEGNCALWSYAPSHDVYMQEYVRQLYLVFLRREPDPQGYNHWLTHLRNTGDYFGLVHVFVNSGEYRSRFAQ
jgi:hypothetical protein